MQPLDLKSIEERPIPGKKQKTATVQFTSPGVSWWKNGEPIVWKRHFPNMKAALQAVQDAKEKRNDQIIEIL